MAKSLVCNSNDLILYTDIWPVSIVVGSALVFTFGVTAFIIMCIFLLVRCLSMTRDRIKIHMSKTYRKGTSQGNRSSSRSSAEDDPKQPFIRTSSQHSKDDNLHEGNPSNYMSQGAGEI